MHRDEASDAVCRCGHARAVHEHYRAGSECAFCPDCLRYRPAGGPLARLVATVFRGRRRP